MLKHLPSLTRQCEHEAVTWDKRWGKRGPMGTQENTDSHYFKKCQPLPLGGDEQPPIHLTELEKEEFHLKM